jgi:hypothetical protein
MDVRSASLDERDCHYQSKVSLIDCHAGLSFFDLPTACWRIIAGFSPAILTAATSMLLSLWWWRCYQGNRRPNQAAP